LRDDEWPRATGDPEVKQPLVLDVSADHGSQHLIGTEDWLACTAGSRPPVRVLGAIRREGPVRDPRLVDLKQCLFARPREAACSSPCSNRRQHTKQRSASTTSQGNPHWTERTRVTPRRTALCGPESPPSR
jgi:hypothetical protein